MKKRHQLSVALMLWVISLSTIQAANFKVPDFSHFKVYGISSPAIHSIGEAQQLITNTADATGALPEQVDTELLRYLTYDLLNHYVAFMLKIAKRPSTDYVNSFAPLEQHMGETFKTLQNQSVRQATDLARAIRFDVTLVKLSTKHIYKSDGKTPIDGEVAVMLERLGKVSDRLAQIYPAGKGELPPVLIAFAASVFEQHTNKVPVSCANPLPGQLKSQVLGSLSNPPAGPFSPLPDSTQETQKDDGVQRF